MVVNFANEISTTFTLWFWLLTHVHIEFWQTIHLIPPEKKHLWISSPIGKSEKSLRRKSKMLYALDGKFCWIFQKLFVFGIFHILFRNESQGGMGERGRRKVIWCINLAFSTQLGHRFSAFHIYIFTFSSSPHPPFHLENSCRKRRKAENFGDGGKSWHCE